MSIQIQPLTAEHRRAVIDIFNHYVEHGFAAYPETPVPYEFFDMFLGMAQHYPAVVVTDESQGVVGFGLLRAYHPMAAFRRTAQVSYFIAPDRTGNGIGEAVLAHLETEARKLGIDTLLADISSLNDGSIRFHTRHGFEPCGRFEKVGRKLGQEFDQVWMRKRL